MLSSMQNVLFNCHTRINLRINKKTRERENIYGETLIENVLLTSITHWGCVVFYQRHSQEACS